MKNYIRKTLLKTNKFEIEVFQQLERIEFGLIIDYSESPFLISIGLLFWNIEFSMYSADHIKLNKKYEATRNNKSS